MAEDFDIEALLEAPYNVSTENFDAHLFSHQPISDMYSINSVNNIYIPNQKKIIIDKTDGNDCV